MLIHHVQMLLVGSTKVNTAVFVVDIKEIWRARIGLHYGSYGCDAGVADGAIGLAVELASASLFQRRMKVGYARAARILDELEAAGYVSTAEGAKPRKVLMKSERSGESDTVEEGI